MPVRDRWTGRIGPEHRLVVLVAVNESSQPNAVNVAARSGLHTELVKTVLRILESDRLVIKPPGRRFYEVTPAGMVEIESLAKSSPPAEEARLQDEAANKDGAISALKAQLATQLERIRELSKTVEEQAAQIQARDALLCKVESVLKKTQKEIGNLTHRPPQGGSGHQSRRLTGI